MGFVKEYRKMSDAFPEWEYLNEIGVRDMLGKPIATAIMELVVDRENGYYLIPQGHTSYARDGEKKYYYALCINDNVINMDVYVRRSGRRTDNTLKFQWIISKTQFPEKWTFNLVDKNKLREIIYSAFVAETYNETLIPESVKDLLIDISAQF